MKDQKILNMKKAIEWFETEYQKLRAEHDQRLEEATNALEMLHEAEVGLLRLQKI